MNEFRIKLYHVSSKATNAVFQLLPDENETQWENLLGIIQDQDWAGPASSVTHSEPWTTLAIDIYIYNLGHSAYAFIQSDTWSSQKKVKQYRQHQHQPYI